MRNGGVVCGGSAQVGTVHGGVVCSAGTSITHVNQGRQERRLKLQHNGPPIPPNARGSAGGVATVPSSRSGEAGREREEVVKRRHGR